jgi:3-methyladenine DNA glycosylase AlkD
VRRPEPATLLAFVCHFARPRRTNPCSLGGKFLKWRILLTEITQLIETINIELKNQADLSYRELVCTRYKMNVDNFWGVRTPTIHKVAGKYYKTLKSESIDERLEMCRHLLATRIYEHKIMAFRWAYLARKEYAPEHLAVFAAWLDEYIDDWIDCDDLCIHVIGEFFLKYPDLAEEVIHWTASPNYWVRRGAAVSLVLPSRKGEQLALVFQVADLLLEDEEDLVRKGYGWLLKVTSKTWPEEVFGYVMDKRDRMPRVSLRYAIEKLPEQMRHKAMEKK